MATLILDTTRRGTIKASGNSGRGPTYDDVRESDTYVTSTTNSPTSDDTNAIEYNKVSDGRGGSTWTFNRTYVDFDCSSLPGGATVTDVKLAVTSSGAAFADGVYILSSSAFSNGTSTLASSEYFSSIDYTTAYATKITSWPAGGNSTSYTLNATAVSDVQNSSRLIAAFVQGEDYDDTDTGFLVSPSRAGFEFSAGADVMSLIITYTPAAGGGPTNIAELSGILSGSIDSFNGVTYSSIDAINSVT